MTLIAYVGPQRNETVCRLHKRMNSNRNGNVEVLINIRDRSWTVCPRVLGQQRSGIANDYRHRCNDDVRSPRLIRNVQRKPKVQNEPKVHSESKVQNEPKVFMGDLKHFPENIRHPDQSIHITRVACACVRVCARAYIGGAVGPAGP
ncbi:hypothetical protein EVAR_78902_1 [Eumeta japonica]|uniref:Uncharacterized protein n=1 Tax=Eumeta variegata TaxID=151549 RepID=A0A4C1U2E1_EUMVA|nr:hypothetical protein EVAR_78902_1 [Eumeta japonica]